MKSLITELREADGKATEGPWKFHKQSCGIDGKSGGVVFGEERTPRSYGVGEVNATLILLLRNNVSRLLDAAEAGIGETESKNRAYKERNTLVALLSKMWPSHLAKHPASDETWEKDWMNLVCIHAPMGQLTWHLHDNDLPMFNHLRYQENDWDGHSTEEKYARVLAYDAAVKGN